MEKSKGGKSLVKILAMFFAAAALSLTIGLVQTNEQQANATELDSYELQVESLDMETQEIDFSRLQGEITSAIEQFQEEFTKISNAVSGVYDDVKAICDEGIEAIQGATSIDEALEIFKPYYEKASGLVKDAFTEAGIDGDFLRNEVGGILSDVWYSLLDIVDQVGNEILEAAGIDPELLEEVQDELNEMFSAIYDDVKVAYDEAIAGISEATTPEEIIAKFQEGMQNIIDTAKTSFDENGLTDLVNALGVLAQDKIDEAKAQIEELVVNVKAGTQEILAAIQEKTGAIVADIQSGLEELIGNIQAKVAELDICTTIEELSQKVNEALDQIKESDFYVAVSTFLAESAEQINAMMNNISDSVTSFINNAATAIDQAKAQAKEILQGIVNQALQYYASVSSIAEELTEVLQDGINDIDVSLTKNDVMKALIVSVKRAQDVLAGGDGLIDISDANVTLAKTKYTYTGKAIKCGVKSATANGISLVAGTDYKIKRTDNVNVGTATVTIIGTGYFTGQASATFKIVKAKNAITAKSSTVTKSYTADKKTGKLAANKTFQLSTTAKVSAKFGKVKYAKTSGDSKIKVSKTGKVTVGKGLVKGKTYKVKVKASVAGTSNYKAAKKVITIKVVIK